MKLYTYFRSSAAYRVRIALNLKGIAYDAVPVHLLRNGGEQLGDAYRAVNPAALLPALEDDGNVIGQSLAIIEYLEETHAQRRCCRKTRQAAPACARWR
jgi:maleylpyruvate isomerase